MARKPGRQPKGDRAAATLRAPRAHYECYTEAARAAGLSLSDYMMVKLAEVHGLEIPDYVNGSNRNQEELPIAISA